MKIRGTAGMAGTAARSTRVAGDLTEHSGFSGEDSGAGTGCVKVVMMLRITARTVELALLLFGSLAWPCTAETTLRVWEIFEVEMTAKRPLSNPYVDGLPEGRPALARVVFSGVSGEARGQRYVISAFWDGGQKWKARFAPPSAGGWSFQSESADPGLSNSRGALRALPWSEAEKEANPTRRGLLYVAKGGPRAGRYFEYADGTPFLWIGDTWWNWAKKGIRLQTFQRLVDDRAAKGFSVGQIFFGGNGGLLDDTYSVPELEQIRRVEEFVSYANSQGITVWLHAWWGGKGLRETVGAEKLRRWWRYVIHRFGAHNVIWVLAGEYNMDHYSGFPLQFWKDLGRMIRTEDPYGRIISTHPTPPLWQGGADAPQWSTGETLHRESWLDYNQSQTGHGKARNEMIPEIVLADYARRPPKPVVVTEPWYEFVRGNPSPEDVRFGMWSAMLSGAAGHSYGGGHIWWAHVPEAPADVGPWPIEESFEVNTLDYPGAVSMGFMARFLRSIRWWLLEPRPDLISGYPARYCAAIPGREYVVYLRWGGRLRLDLRPSSESDRFRFTWIDLNASQARPEQVVQGGAIREFHAPEGYPSHPQFKDWLLHVVREAGAESPRAAQNYSRGIGRWHKPRPGARESRCLCSTP